MAGIEMNGTEMDGTEMAAEQIVRVVMDEWKAGIDSHDPGRVAAVFTQDAVFQGLRPYGVGRQTVADYYAAQPVGMTVGYRVLESRSPATDVVLGYLAATFSYPDRADVELAIGVAITRGTDGPDGGWNVAQYQASALP